MLPLTYNTALSTFVCASAKVAAVCDIHCNAYNAWFHFLLLSVQCTNVVDYLNHIEIFSCCWWNTEVGQHRAILLWPVPVTAVSAPNQGGQRNGQAIFGLLLFDPLVGWLSQMWWFRTRKSVPHF